MYNSQQLIKDLNSYSAVKLPHFRSVRLQDFFMYQVNVILELSELGCEVSHIFSIVQDPSQP